jgi:two-component system, OmpR family, response regulator
MVRLNVEPRHEPRSALGAPRIRVVVRRGRGGGIHVTIAGVASVSSVPRLMRALRAVAADHTAADALRLYPDSRVVLRGEQPIPLTRREFDLLLFLVEHPGRVFTRPQLLSAVWGYEYASERTIDVHIRRLRAKVGQPLFATVYRVGYRLDEETVATVIRET